jgi:hypothetical protein
MQPVFHHPERRPEAMSDVPGVCELPLTRAVIQYRSAHEADTPGGRIQDIGLAVVLAGHYASSAEVVDLGSAEVKTLDLSGELVVLDWVYEPTLDHLAALVRKAAAGDRDELERFCARAALTVLERAGFGPLTRSTLLRVGFRDICRDLDLHEGTSVRVVLDAGRVVRAHLDYDGNALVFRTPTAAVDEILEEALMTAFPQGELRRLVPASEAASGGYQVRFPLPLSLAELRGEIDRMRAGLVRLLERFEPDRLATVERVTSTFGSRRTLVRLRDRRRAVETRPVGRSDASSAADTVH